MKETKFNKYHCQHCGCEYKYVETLIDDECFINENGEAQFIGLADDFSHTGLEVCKNCGKEWTGAEPIEWL